MTYSSPYLSVVESALTMELVLNLVWTLLAATMVFLWIRFGPKNSMSRRMQFLALAVLLLILFPVVSVTDDLQAAQNPAEADCLMRRYHACSVHHSVIPHISAFPPASFTDLPLLVHHIEAPGALTVRVSGLPALAPIQNRPPPVA